MIEESAINKWLHRCIRCANCKYVFKQYEPSCPSGEMFGFETYYASGRIGLARGLSSKDLQWDESLLQPIFACTTCGSCEVQCLAPHSEAIVEIIEELRSEAVKVFGPLSAHQTFSESVREYHNPYKERHHNRILLEEHNLPEIAEYVYFIGCTANYRENAIRDATISVLKKAGINFTIIDEYCCGSPLIRTGQLDQISALARHNKKAIEATGASYIITSCSGCYRTMARDYLNHDIQLEVEVIHSVQFLSTLLREGKLDIKAEPELVTLTYHDPCHLGRHMGVFDAPRQVIEHLPFELVEMKTNRENAWCCGAGGGVRAQFKEMSRNTAEMRIKQASEIGVCMMVSACPFCVNNLRESITDYDLEVIDIIQLVDRFTL